jgi:hypothetical protein
MLSCSTYPGRAILSGQARCGRKGRVRRPPVVGRQSACQRQAAGSSGEEPSRHHEGRIPCGPVRYPLGSPSPKVRKASYIRPIRVHRSACIATMSRFSAAATIGRWPMDDFHRITRGHHRDRSCRSSHILHGHRYRAQGPSESQFLQCDCTARPPRTTRSKTNDPQCPFPTWLRFCDSAIADKE